MADEGKPQYNPEDIRSTVEHYKKLSGWSDKQVLNHFIIHLQQVGGMPKVVDAFLKEEYEDERMDDGLPVDDEQ